MLRLCKFCEQAGCCRSLQALKEAAANGDSIHELEFVGVTHRTLNLLDDAGVVFLADLIGMTQEEVIAIDSLGQGGVAQITQGFCEFNLVSPIRAKAEADLRRIIAKYDRDHGRAMCHESVAQIAVA